VGRLELLRPAEVPDQFAVSMAELRPRQWIFSAAEPCQKRNVSGLHEHISSLPHGLDGSNSIFQRIVSEPTQQATTALQRPKDAGATPVMRPSSQPYGMEKRWL